MTQFSKILIANRGEIACRIMRTARAMGYRTVAVYSDADRDALHTRMADEAMRIGPAPVRDSYLDIASVLAAAKASGADAIHPGYGFLSENDEFAAACETAGLTFIGPTAASIQAMGNKAAAKRLMIEAGVPCVPGYQGADQSDEALTREAERIGFPIMVKAAAGGGGRGMRLVAKPEELARALSTARSEAQNAFGSGELILEKAVVDARHIEIQVFGDAHGAVIHLGERDCSIQRRHQKVVEEAPSPAVSADLRARMGAAAVAAAKAIDYRGAGTVEFLLDASGAFYFLEMNTRLQVEHPVTEEISGLDLVEWQLRVAAGEKLPLTQAQVQLSGHAIEARLYAEDPSRRLIPQTGDTLVWAPATGIGVRVDHGIASGQAVSPYYDPMIAKVIAHGRDREEARRRLVRALEDTVLLGLTNNRAFLIATLNNPAFIAGAATTAFIGAQFPKGLPKAAPSSEVLALAAALIYDRTAHAIPDLMTGWDSTGVFFKPMRLSIGDKQHFDVALRAQGGDRFEARICEETLDISILDWTDDHARYVCAGRQQRARYLFRNGQIHLDLGGAQTFALRESSLETSKAGEKGAESRLLAPMNGRIVSVLAAVGDKVRKGQRVVVLEAMKMQHEIVAARDGIIASVSVKEGDQVATRHVLAALQDEPAKS